MGVSYDAIIKQKSREWKTNNLVNGYKNISGKKLPFSSPLMNYALYGGIPAYGITEFLGAPSGGKAQPLYSKILTPAGFTTMGEVHVGDTIFDGNGRLCHVLKEYPQGKRPIFEITTRFGNKIRVADNHLNTVWWWDSDHHTKVYETWTTLELIDQFRENYTNKKSDCRKLFRFDNPSVEFEFQNVPVDPYLLGLLIGDGSLSNNFSFCNPESDLVEKCNNLLHEYDYELVQYGNSDDPCNWSIRVIPDKYIPGQKTFLRKSLENLGLMCKSVDKHIPKIYLINSREVRVALLKGLFDTDGSIYADGKMTYSTSSPQLSEDFSFLVRSLGGEDSVVTSIGRYRDDSGNLHVCNLAFEHSIKFNDDFILPFSSEKHTKRFVPGRRNSWRSISSIKYVGLQECKCIYVDSPAHTYISDDFLPTHNTTSAVDICKNAYQIFKKEYDDECDRLREIVNKGIQESKIAQVKLNELQDRGVKKVLYFDLEHSFDDAWSKKLGIQEGEVDVIQPPNVFAEDILQTVQQLVETGEVGLIVLDSIPSLITQQEMDKKYGERTVASLAGLMTTFCRKITPLLPQYGCTLIFINQIRDNMDNPYVIQSPGGQAIKFYASLRLLFKIGHPVDFLGNELTMNAENPAGYIITMKILKQKSAPNDRRAASYYLMTQSGIRTDIDVVQLGIKKYGFIQKSGAWMTLCDPTTGEIIMDEEDKPAKICGLAKVYEWVQAHPDYLKKCEEFVLGDIGGVPISGEEDE